MLYSSMPVPVAFTIMLPNGAAQVGCVTAGAVTTGTGFTAIFPFAITFPQPPVNVTE